MRLLSHGWRTESTRGSCWVSTMDVGRKEETLMTLNSDKSELFLSTKIIQFAVINCGPALHPLAGFLRVHV